MSTVTPGDGSRTIGSVLDGAQAGAP